LIIFEVEKVSGITNPFTRLTLWAFQLGFHPTLKLDHLNVTQNGDGMIAE